MKEQEKERIKFFEKTNDLKLIDDGLKFTHDRLKHILDEWRKVTDGAPLTMEMVSDFTKRNFLGARLPDPDKILKYTMTEKVRHSPLFGEIDLDALIGMTTKKPDITGLVDAVHGICDTIPAPLEDFSDHFRPECFRINGDRVEMVTDKIEEVRSAYVGYATNTEEKHRLKLVQAIIGAYDDLRAEYDIPLYNASVAGLIAYDPVKEELRPAPDFVKHGKIYDANWISRTGSRNVNTTATIGDIRAQVPHNSTVGDGELDAIRKLAEKRNAQVTR